MKLQNQKLKKIIFFVPIIVVSLILIVRSLLPDLLNSYYNLIREDGPVEYLTVIVYLMSFTVSILLLRYFRKDRKFFLIFVLFTIGFLLIAMEEISWGQRIFNFNSPSWFPNNVQGETNLHNVDVLMQYRHGAIMAVSIYGMSSWFVFPKIQNKFQIFSQKTYQTILRVMIPDKYLVGYFIPIFIVLLIFDLSYSPLTNMQLGIKFIVHEMEPFELMMGIGIFIFIFQSYSKQKFFQNKSSFQK